MKLNYLAICISFILLHPNNIFGQSHIILTTTPQQVPEGKKWVLPSNKSCIIQVNEGTTESGNLCNAMINSNPRSVSEIMEGDFYRPSNVYTIVFKSINKVAYTNDFTYSITPLYFNSSPYMQVDNTSQISEMIFYPHQTVHTWGCLQSIELIEMNLTAKDISLIKEKDLNVKQVKQSDKVENIQPNHIASPTFDYQIYVAKNIQYPVTAREKGIQGRVIVKFVVNEDGTISNAEVIRGIGGGCDEECIRLVLAMPKWTPAIEYGKVVKSTVTEPFSFNLQ